MAVLAIPASGQVVDVYYAGDVVKLKIPVKARSGFVRKEFHIEVLISVLSGEAQLQIEVPPGEA